VAPEIISQQGSSMSQTALKQNHNRPKIKSLAEEQPFFDISRSRDTAWFRFSFWADGFSAETPLLSGLSRRYSIKNGERKWDVAVRIINDVMPQDLISYRPGRDSASDFTTVDARSDYALSKS
jgi:hypothetical protein